METVRMQVYVLIAWRMILDDRFARKPEKILDDCHLGPDRTPLFLFDGYRHMLPTATV